MRLNSPHINIITKACMKASRSLIRDFGEVENLQVSTKGPGDFVTSSDRRTEKIIIDELQKAHPDYGIITEESGVINPSNVHNRWIIDPIDGTVNFLNGVTALIDDGLSACNGGVSWGSYSAAGSCGYVDYVSKYHNINKRANGFLTYPSSKTDATPADIIDEMNMLLTGGRISTNNTRILLQNYENFLQQLAR